MINTNTKATVHAKHTIGVNETFSPTTVIMSYIHTNSFIRISLGVLKHILLISEGILIRVRMKLLYHVFISDILTNFLYPLFVEFMFKSFCWCILFIINYDYHSCLNLFNLLHELIDKTCDGMVIEDSLVINDKQYPIKINVPSDTDLLELSKYDAVGSSIDPDCSSAQKYREWVFLGFLIGYFFSYIEKKT